MPTFVNSTRLRRPLSLPRPLHLYVGRVAVEKNLEAFLSLSTAGSKLVVGDGPALPELKRKFPGAHFLGPKFGQELASLYASADVFVFPSLTETFGLVMLESLASGTPVAAFPAPGPLYVLADSRVGSMNSDLSLAIQSALQLRREDCSEYAKNLTWNNSVAQFQSCLVPIHVGDSYPISESFSAHPDILLEKPVFA